MQRVERLAENAYIVFDGRNEIVAKQVLEFFTEGLMERIIRSLVVVVP